jgi:hypothetical protein
MPITNAKDDALKIRRLLKNKNNNKQKNKTIKHFKNNGSCQMFYGYHKALQQFLYDEYGIKVHKNKLRQYGFLMRLIKKNYSPDISYYDNNNYNYIDLDDNDYKIKFTGNIELSKLHYILDTYLQSDENKIPIDWSQKHDKTRWTRSKIHTKIRKNQREYKESLYE